MLSDSVYINLKSRLNKGEEQKWGEGSPWKLRCGGSGREACVGQGLSCPLARLVTRGLTL